MESYESESKQHALDLDEAKVVLDSCERAELRDHAFGDVEVSWTKDDKEIADGYFGGGVYDVCVKLDSKTVTFSNEQALKLRNCGTLAEVGRNDETGPDTYVEGVIMPGLTLEGVRKELTDES